MVGQATHKRTKAEFMAQSLMLPSGRSLNSLHHQTPSPPPHQQSPPIMPWAECHDRKFSMLELPGEQSAWSRKLQAQAIYSNLRQTHEWRMSWRFWSHPSRRFPLLVSSLAPSSMPISLPHSWGWDKGLCLVEILGSCPEITFPYCACYTSFAFSLLSSIGIADQSWWILS